MQRYRRQRENYDQPRRVTSSGCLCYSVGNFARLQLLRRQ
jgi:hypothetical protein